MKLQITLVSILAGMVATANAGVNLVTNGGFETSNYTGDDWHKVSAGSDELTGWTVGGNSIDINGNRWPSHSGSYTVDLAGTPGPGSISQTIGTLTVGTEYTVSFWAKGGSYPNDQVEMTFGGQSSTFDVTGAWAEYSVTGYASSASQILALATRSNNFTKGNVFIDDVSVTEAVPEPMTLAALGFGLAAIARKRRK